MKKTLGLITAAVFIGHMLFAMANNAQGVLLSDFIEAFGLTSSRQGLPNAAANAGILLSMLLAVPLASRVGKARLFAGGLGLMGLMLALAGAARGTLWLAFAYLVMGLAFGSIDTTASSLIADLYTGPGAGRYMGLLHAVYGIGGILSPILMGAAMGAGATWRMVLIGLAVLALAASALAGGAFSRGGQMLARQSAPPERITRAGLLAFARQRGNLLLVLCCALYCAHQVSIYLWVSRIVTVHYESAALGAASLSLFWVGTVLSRLIVPATGLPMLRYLRYGMLLTALALAVCLCIGGAVAICVAAALSGLLGGAVIPMLLTEASRRNPQRSMLAITAMLLTTALSAILCAPLIGFVVGKTSLLAGLFVSAICALACAAAAFGVRSEPA